jgi:hypothetical protein
MTTFIAAFCFFIRTLEIADAAFETSPGTYLTKEGSYEQARAALKAATPEISAEVLLGLAWVESRYHAGAVSRVEDGKRVTGVPRWKSPPSGTRSFFCGVTQVSAGDSWKKCREFQDVHLAYQTAIIELNRWLAPRVCNHNLVCALTGYNGGFPAIKVGTRYAATVMWRSRLIKRALHRKNI